MGTSEPGLAFQLFYVAAFLALFSWLFWLLLKSLYMRSQHPKKRNHRRSRDTTEDGCELARLSLWLAAHIVEVHPSSHIRGDSHCESRNLRVHVGQEYVARPAANFHDGFFLITI